jgi:hypothetical protein
MCLNAIATDNLNQTIPLQAEERLGKGRETFLIDQTYHK